MGIVVEIELVSWYFAKLFTRLTVSDIQTVGRQKLHLIVSGNMANASYLDS
jgi:hypothetical protein